LPKAEGVWHDHVAAGGVATGHYHCWPLRHRRQHCICYR
jgi:hypothetical protein